VNRKDSKGAKGLQLAASSRQWALSASSARVSERLALVMLRCTPPSHRDVAVMVTAE